MNIVPFEKKVKYERDISNDFILYKETLEKEVIKDISKELAKGYIKLLSNAI